MQAAEHGATFPMARKLRQSMTHQQLHDFSVGFEKNKPNHVGMRASLKSHPNAARLGKYLHAKRSR